MYSANFASWMGREKRTESVQDKLWSALRLLMGQHSFAWAENLAQAAVWPLFAMNGYFMLTRLQPLFLIPDPNMRVLEQCLSQM